MLYFKLFNTLGEYTFSFNKDKGIQIMSLFVLNNIKGDKFFYQI